jgi:GGDEF domain-containing protein
MQMIQSWIDVASSRQSQNDSAKLLFDEVTNLPTVPLLFNEMREILKDRGQMGLLYINVVQYSMIAYIYGWKTFDTLVREVVRCLINVKDNYLRKQDYLGEVTINGNALVLLLSPPRTNIPASAIGYLRIAHHLG